MKILTLVIAIVVAILIVAAGVVLSVAPLKSVTYSELEPYITTETYYVTETSTEEIPLDYKVIDTKISNWYWRVSSDCIVTIKNTDVESGYFRIEFNMATLV